MLWVKLVCYVACETTIILTNGVNKWAGEIPLFFYAQKVIHHVMQGREGCGKGYAPL